MDKINMLTLIKEIPRTKPYGKNLKKGVFLCDCGNETVAVFSSVKGGHTKSCGCLQKRGRHITHGMSGTAEYVTWLNMKQRCNNPKNTEYKNYGGRGISVCAKWQDSFHEFIKSMGRKPTKAHSIDRINVNGDYSESNTRWAIPKEQARNTRKNRLLTAYGVTACVSEWSEIMEIDSCKIFRGISKGLSDHDCIFRKMNNNHGRYIMAYGESLIILKWAKAMEIPHSRILDRANKLGWSDHDAIFKSSTKKKFRLRKLAIELKRDFDFDL